MEMDIILVDERDNQLGTMGKLEVHQKALLHRAFSVFIFNNKQEMLLHKRAEHKYHSGGLWTNACCSHPKPEQDILTAAHLRLQEEMGFTCTLIKAFDFIYRTSFDNGLTEHEFDHVFIGYYNGEINFNSDEVADCCFKPIDEIEKSVQLNPEQYTEWFKIAFPKMQGYLQKII